ncbi:MAG TPA: haloalkane dehalogenase [Mycobacteriales bacterium]|nr:haloalkane dehalogenase [Mycobacteriales bacterium]
MKVLRTPDERFADLPDFPFDPHYAEVADGDGGRLRMHYLDEGPRDGDVVVLMHGEPSWSFLYRKMIPVLTGRGFRCIAPDLVGFGRSDKPTERADYSYARHVAWIRELLVDQLDLTGVTFFGQDWGGLIGLRVVAENPDRFDRVVIGNTGLPTGDNRITEGFLRWQKFSQETPDFNVGVIVSMAVVNKLDPAVQEAYNAPFPDDSYKAGARVFPMLVPTSPDDPASEANRAAWKVFESWDKPLLTAFSDSDPVTVGGDRVFQEKVPGAKGRPHVTIEQAGHFLQEDKGPEIATLIADFIDATR